MNDTPDKALPAEERFKAACIAHGLTQDDVGKIGLSPGGQDVLFAIAKQAGITREEHEAMFGSLAHDVHISPGAVSGGLAGGGIAAAGLAIAQIVKKGRTSWEAFAEAAPKTTAVGAVLGAIAGIAGAMHVNSNNRWLRREANAHWDEQEAKWQKKEAARKATTPEQSPAK